MRPNAIESEKQILADVFAGRIAFTDLAELAPSDFFDPTLRGIFQSMDRLQRTGEPWTAVELIEHADAEAMRVMGQLMTWPMSGGILHKHIAKLKDAATRRAIIDACNEMAMKAVDGSAEDALSFAQERVMRISEKRLNSEARFIRDAMADWLDEMERRRESSGDYYGIPSGFPGLDKIIGGFEPGELIVIAGRPGSGKTTLGMNIAQNAARRDSKSILVFSMEMSEHELVTRLCANKGRVPMGKLLNQKLMGNPEFEGLTNAVTWAYDAPLCLIDSAGLTSKDIMARANAHKLKHGLQMVVIDYLGLIKPLSDKSSYEAVSKDTAAMKTMAKMLNVPVILLVQMNRAVEGRADPRPKLSDLRDSGSIEQDANSVIFVTRPHQHSEDEPDDYADISVLKNRKGRTGVTRLVWKGEFNAFIEPDYRF